MLIYNKFHFYEPLEAISRASVCSSVGRTLRLSVEVVGSSPTSPIRPLLLLFLLFMCPHTKKGMQWSKLKCSGPVDGHGGSLPPNTWVRIPPALFSDSSPLNWALSAREEQGVKLFE